MSKEYLPLKDVKCIIEENFPIYWARIFKIIDDFVLPSGIKVKKDNRAACSELKNLLSTWEKKVQIYRDEIAGDFGLDLFDEDNEEAYEYQEFKDTIFSVKLWTVSSALRTKDPQLERYKAQYLRTPAKDIFVTTYNILKGALNYMNNEASSINFHKLASIEELKYDFLDEDDKLLTGVIGLGIRSEILHRLYPSHFTIMTRRSLWGMYYLTGELDEFVDDSPPFDGKVRTEHNWNYNYKRFSFYNNFLCNLIEEKINKTCGFKLDQSLRFGYVNHFLTMIHEQHKQEIEVLTAWQYVGG